MVLLGLCMELSQSHSAATRTTGRATGDLPPLCFHSLTSCQCLPLTKGNQRSAGKREFKGQSKSSASWLFEWDMVLGVQMGINSPGIGP